MKTITIYNLAKLILENDGRKTDPKPERFHRFANTVAKNQQYYIDICKSKNLL